MLFQSKNSSSSCLVLVEKLVEDRSCKSSAEFWPSVSITADCHCCDKYIPGFMSLDSRVFPDYLVSIFALMCLFGVETSSPCPFLCSSGSKYVFAFFSSCIFLLLPPTLLQPLTLIFQGWVAFTHRWNRSFLFGCHFKAWIFSLNITTSSSMNALIANSSRETWKQANSSTETWMQQLI